MILAVDDDPDLLDLLTFALEHAGHEVLTAPAGPAALTLAEHRTIDLVVTDFHMPGMTGVQLAEHLRAAPATHSVPIVVVSAAADSRNDPAGVITRWLTKPFSPRQLRTDIAEVLAAA